jgi:hypothetical protein
LPPAPKIVGIEVEEHVDWTGDDALRVTAILDEDVDVENVSGRGVSDLKLAIHDRLLERGIQLFPYVHLVKQSERVVADEEAE